MNKIVVLGASPSPDRYAYKAVMMLRKYNYEVIAIGKQKGTIGDVQIMTEQSPINGVHTVLMYLAPYHQGEIFDYVISLKPKRVVFNPGTETPEFEEILDSYNVEIVHDCSLMMLMSNRF